MTDPMGNSKIPGETVSYQLQMNNSSLKGNNAWKKPVIAFKAPQYLNVVSMSENGVPVDYTPRKFVKKPSGARPGLVIYSTNRTLYVTPDAAAIQRLRDNARGE